MNEVGIENRRGSAGGGIRFDNHIYESFQRLIPSFPETDHIHFNGFYIGNFPGIKSTRIEDLVAFFNNFAQKNS